MADILFMEYLKRFGLTGQEATIYEVLLHNDAMTGYEISKECGISRSNVYGSLNGLVEKGGAYLIEGEPSRYLGVDIEKFCENTMRELQEYGAYLIANTPKKQETTQGYLTIQGCRQIHNVIREMLANCEMRLYILAQKQLIERYETELQRLIQEGKKIVIMTKGYHLDGAIVYDTEPEPNQIRLITDSAYVLTGELKETENDSCLYSGQKNLVEIMKEALRNRITLIELHQDVSDSNIN